MENRSILCFDPGNSTGWCFIDRENYFSCGTIGESHQWVAEKIFILHPDIIVYETFALYPSMAKSLAWNSFYPCEVIGVIKYLAAVKGIELVGQNPSVKKYAGPLPEKFFRYLIEYNEPKTEHCKDATQHLCYYLRQEKSINRVFG